MKKNQQAQKNLDLERNSKNTYSSIEQTKFFKYWKKRHAEKLSNIQQER